MNDFKDEGKRVRFVPKLVWVLILFLLTAVPVRARGASDYISDLAPPRITVISPERDSVTDTDKPQIEIQFVDLESDIDDTTIRLILDRMDVSGRAVMERTDVTGQAPHSPRLIRYQPAMALSGGVHQVYFSVRDLAGNLSEVHWKFTIRQTGGKKIQWGGSNTLECDFIPIDKTSDTLNLTVQGQIRETTVEFNLSEEGMDYPNGTPDFRYKGYNFYHDKYSLAFYRKQATAVLGYASPVLDSELFQLGSEVIGGAANDTINMPNGQYHWSVFSGASGTTSGLIINGYRTTGISGGWRSLSGCAVEGFYVNLYGSEGDDFIGIKGDAAFGESCLLRYETVYGASKADDTSGNAIALHLDKPLDASNIGFDYMLLQPDYPSPSSSLGIGLSGGGMELYTFRGNIIVDESQNIDLNASFSRNDLDCESASTTHKNLSLLYHVVPIATLELNVSYLGDLQHNEADGDKARNTVLVGMKKDFQLSSIQSTVSFAEVSSQNLFESQDLLKVFAAWTWTLGPYHLTPSLQWTFEDDESGEYSKGSSLRLTLDRQFGPGLSRSSIAIFASRSDQLTLDKNDLSRKTTDTTIVGLESALYVMIWPDSKLSIIYDCAKNGEYWDESFKLTWQINF